MHLLVARVSAIADCAKSALPTQLSLHTVSCATSTPPSMLSLLLRKLRDIYLLRARHRRNHSSADRVLRRAQHLFPCPRHHCVHPDTTSQSYAGEVILVATRPRDAMETGEEYQLVADLINPERREAVLLELSKKRELYANLAPLLWYSFGTVAALLQEITAIYPLLQPPTLTAHASNRVCNALALLQCVASHKDTKAGFLQGTFLPSQLCRCSVILCSPDTNVLVPFPQLCYQDKAFRVSATDKSGGHWSIGEDG